MNSNDNDIIQAAKDGNGAVYRLIGDLRSEISKLQIENNKLQTENNRLKREFQVRASSDRYMEIKSFLRATLKNLEEL